MKKSLAIFAALAVISSPAFANWQSDIQSAISAGNSDQIAAVYAANPDQQTAITMELLTTQQKVFDSNPTLAATLYKSASLHVADITSSDAKTDAKLIRDIVNKIKDPAYQKEHPKETAQFLSASLTMAGSPVIASADPGLYEYILVASNEFILKDPKTGADSGLNNQVSLAQTSGFAPTTPTGPSGPSAD